MKNILKIIASDIKRLSVNVVAIIVIIGLTVIPCLYAWFNILSNWDPYGAESTTNLQVAVASSDQGVVIGGIELNVGNMIVSNLKENTTIGWVFTDTEEEAVDGVYAGDYYAALTIDEAFSQDLISFLGGDINNPKITYYENEKKNAIAPKITNKVKTTVKNEVNEAFISTIAEVIVEASEYIVTVDTDGNITGAAIEKMEDLDSDLNAVILLLDSYLSLMDSTEELVKSAEAVADEVDSMMSSAEGMAQTADAASDAAKTSVEAMSSIIKSGLSSIDDALDEVEDFLDDLDPTPNNGTNLATKVQLVYDSVYTPMLTSWNSSKTALSVTNSTEVANIDAAMTKLGTDLEALKSNAAKNDTDSEAIVDDISDDVANCKSALSSVSSSYTNTVEPQLKTTMSSVNTSIAQIEKILNYRSSAIDSVAKSLNSYPDMMSQPRESLEKAREETVEMEEQLSALIEEMKDVEQDDQYSMVINLIETDPSFIADFVSSPVNLEENPVYPVENNGSATAPFYIVLSIWVGSLIMSTILKTKVINTEGMENLKNWQCFFGRYFTTFVIGQIQTLITVFGALWYVKIQCLHPFLFWVACAWTSMVYSMLLYSFTYSFGNVGEALSVILMVIQVAGAGGTFPIEVLPKVFQYLYKFMPFNYSMNALRECVGGFYEYNYWWYLLTLTIYVVVAIVIGICLYGPFKRLIEAMEKSKEKSGILI